MAVDVLTVVETYRLALYDGTNGTEVAALFGVTPDSDDGSTLVFTEPLNNNEIAVDAGQVVSWFVAAGGQQVVAEGGGLPAATVGTRHALLPTLVTSAGEATLPASVLGGQQTVDVTLTPALPDTSPVPQVELRGSTAALLGGHVVTSATVLDMDTVRVVVQSGATAPAGVVRVVAHALATA